MKFSRLHLLFTFILLIGSVFQSLAQGNLVIVGGGLEADNKSVFDTFINLAGGPAHASVAIIPSSSGVPMQSYVSFRNILVSYGVNPANIHLIDIAMVDDDSTKDVNESEWKNNGNDPVLAEEIRKCTGVWFTGGDQTRAVKMLYRPDGSRTPALEAVWDVYKKGGVIGGSSAGAALMSGIMIGGGTSLAALTHGIIRKYDGNDFPEDTGVLVTKGLGFFQRGIIDQHFNTRDRIGRLALVLVNEKQTGLPGFGIDENTAVIYSGKQDRVTVAGAGGVTLIDAAESSISYIRDLPAIKDLIVSHLEEGDSWDASTGIITPAAGKQDISGKEKYKDPYAGQAGLLSGRTDSFRELITRSLADNSATDTVSNITFTSPDKGFRVTLRKTNVTRAFSDPEPGHRTRYTVIHFRMDIEPIHISLEPINSR